MVNSRYWAPLAAALLSACTPPATSKMLVVPNEMRRTPPPTTGSLKSAAADRVPAPSSSPKYVLRMAENGRVWEMELPESLGGYEVRLPMAGGGGPAEMLTSADEEMLAESVLSGRAVKTAAPGDAKSDAKADPKAPGDKTQKPGEGRLLDASQAARTRSYLGGVARVKEMYGARRYELALIELVSLEQEYPQDARLLAMKGSLYLKLNQPKLARQAWERALSINPDDAGVAEALRATTAGEE